MFFRQHKKQSTIDQTSVVIQTIPDVFYGGKDPEIHYTSTQVSKKKSEKYDDTIMRETPSFWSEKKIHIIVGVTMSLAVIAGISWYYIHDAKKQVLENKPASLSPATPSAQNTMVSSTSKEESSALDMPLAASTTLPVSFDNQGIIFPRLLLPDSTDLDSDALTDLEEEIFGTDSGTWDTDADGYYDGQEVQNLYNPAGQAPVRLVDSGLVSEYINPTWSYRLYVPTGWQIGAVDTASDQVLFNAITGDFIEVRAIARNQGETFSEWFGQHASGQQFSDLRSETNRFQKEVFLRNDRLVAYVPEGVVVYVIIYHPGTTGTIPYRHVLGVMVQSFRSGSQPSELPEQVFPTTSSSLENQPPTTTLTPTTSTSST